MKTAEEYEQEILQELFDNGDMVDCDFYRILNRRAGIISERIKEYAEQKAASLPDDEAIEKQFPYARSLTDYGAQIGAKWMRSKFKN